MVSSSQLRQKCLVYVVEPHPIAAFHLAATLKRNPALEVSLSDINLLGDRASPGKPSVVIIDAGELPFPSVPFVHTVRTVFGDARILVIGRHLCDDELSRLLFHGVSGFVTYEKVEQEICAAVDALVRGHMWYPPQVLERYAMLSSATERPTRQEQGGLSPRQTEVVGLLQRRLSNKEIGSALGISERTVRFHLHCAFEKVGVDDRYSLMEWARSAAPTQSRREVAICEAA